MQDQTGGQIVPAHQTGPAHGRITPSDQPYMSALHGIWTADQSHVTYLAHRAKSFGTTGVSSGTAKEDLAL